MKFSNFACVVGLSCLYPLYNAIGDEPSPPATQAKPIQGKPDRQAQPLPIPSAKTPEASISTKEIKWAPAVNPKPLSDQVQKGLKWLTEHQLKNGAWGQGEESAQMGGGASMKDVASLADTCMAALALIRAGSTPAKGEYSKKLLDAVNYVCGEVEESDKDSLMITHTHGTRIQTKLGTYIDTFATSLLLAEITKSMPTAEGQNRVAAALDKVLAKIKKNQRSDGAWEGTGWATTMQQNFAVKSLNRATQNGAPVDEKVRELAETKSRKSFDNATKSFSSEGSAGVALYSAGANLSNLNASVITNGTQTADLKQQAVAAAAPEVRLQATAKLQRFKDVEKDLAQQQAAVVAKLDDKQFLAGFGSNGGEEFLSYLNIGESLVCQGGDTWKTWDKSITQNLNRIQNSDGSWSGNHCITGRTVCTSAALLVLMVDRSPMPISAKMKQR